MLTLDRKQRPLSVREQQGFEPPFLAGLLFAALELVPLSSPAPFTAMRVAGVLGLAAAAGLLIARGVPRSRRRSLTELAAHPSKPREPGVALALDGFALPPTYRAVVVFQDGTRRTVLEHGDPARVLEDAALVAHEVGLPLVAGWGIDDGTIDLLLRPADHGARWGDTAPITFEAPPFAGQRHAAWTTLWASAFVVVATILMSESARAQVTPSLLSMILPGISALVVLLVGLWLVGARGTLVLGPAGITRHRFWFNVELGSTEALEFQVAAATVVLPPGGSVGHLVVSDGAALRTFQVRGGTPQTQRLSAAFSPHATHRAAE